MVFALKNRYPEFTNEATGEKKNTFTRDLLNICQGEFEWLQDNFRPLEEEEKNKFDNEADLNIFLIKRKKRALTNMKWVGHFHCVCVLGLINIHHQGSKLSVNLNIE